MAQLVGFRDSVANFLDQKIANNRNQQTPFGKTLQGLFSYSQELRPSSLKLNVIQHVHSLTDKTDALFLQTLYRDKSVLLDLNSQEDLLKNANNLTCWIKMCLICRKAGIESAAKEKLRRIKLLAWTDHLPFVSYEKKFLAHTFNLILAHCTEKEIEDLIRIKTSSILPTRKYQMRIVAEKTMKFIGSLFQNPWIVVPLALASSLYIMEKMKQILLKMSLKTYCVLLGSIVSIGTANIWFQARHSHSRISKILETSWNMLSFAFDHQSVRISGEAMERFGQTMGGSATKFAEKRRKEATEQITQLWEDLMQSHLSADQLLATNA